MPTLMEGTNPIAGLIPDRGSVSVTGNGVKTYATLLNELFATLDLTKVTQHSKVVYSGNVYTIENIRSDRLVVIHTEATATATDLYKYRIESTGSQYLKIQIDNTPAYNVSDFSNIVVADGYAITLYY